MRTFLMSLLLILSAGTTPQASQPVMISTRAASDVTLSTDPNIAFWQAARPVYFDKGRSGESHARYRTEVRSRWTERNLYFLFICPYEELNLKADPSTSTETFKLWNWDVAEIFIGSDFKNIQRYKEFEISPQGEWIDLDIDLSRPHHEDGWKWNSGFRVASRIDTKARIWYGAMQIPISALRSRPPAPGDQFRVDLFRSQGSGANQVQLAWKPTMRETFHVPEKFGLLQLSASSAR